MQHRQQGMTQEIAAAKSAISPRTARRIEQSNTLPRVKADRDWVSALESASFFPKISSSHLKSITSSLDFHYDHSRTC